MVRAQETLGSRTHAMREDILARITRCVLRWGRRNFQPYPWRVEEDPWVSFVAEFLLQRTRASQVASVFDYVRTRYPTAEIVARIGAREIGDLTARLGLHRRGPQLIRIAEEIAQRGGTPPSTMEELCQLTGVGRYTAAAWLSFHGGRRAVIVDANVCRWLGRMTGLPYNRDPRHVRWVQELANRLTPRRVFREYNYAVLDFTMEICRPREPACERCPLWADCHYYEGNGNYKRDPRGHWKRDPR